MRKYCGWFEIAKIRDIIKRLTDLEELIGFEMSGDLFPFFGLDTEIEFLCDTTETADCSIDLYFFLIICDLRESLFRSL
jgi:hypothetical protein